MSEFNPLVTLHERCLTFKNQGKNGKDCKKFRSSLKLFDRFFKMFEREGTLPYSFEFCERVINKERLDCAFLLLAPLLFTYSDLLKVQSAQYDELTEVVRLAVVEASDGNELAFHDLNKIFDVKSFVVWALAYLAMLEDHVPTNDLDSQQVSMQYDFCLESFSEAYG